MPVLPKHAIAADKFEETSLVPPIGSGPYLVEDIRPGVSVTFKRNPEYWGRDLAVNRGLWNFDEVRIEFYRDGNAELEAFKKGLSDLRVETDPGRWKTAYTFPAVHDRHVRTGVQYPSTGVCRHSGPGGDCNAVRLRMAQSQLFL
jgi:peptide/nickel transport system substrate-binding protein